MRILITNDDGMYAEQLIPLIRWCQKLGNITVFVPKYEQSGKSHSFEIRHPFEAKQIELEPGITVWAVDSTPADCVRLAVLGLKMEFDLVISGINRGFNMGADIMYSGTVAAASEAVNLGIPAIALSTSPSNYAFAIEELDRVFTLLHKHDLMKVSNFYNINIPPKPKGIRITHQGGPYFSDKFIPMDNNMYSPSGYAVWEDSCDDTLDTDATLHGYITVTPMTINRTDKDVYRKIAQIAE